MHCIGRHLDISRESHKLIDAKVQQGGFEVVKEAFDLGRLLPVLCSVRQICADIAFAVQVMQTKQRPSRSTLCAVISCWTPAGPLLGSLHAQMSEGLRS